MRSLLAGAKPDKDGIVSIFIGNILAAAPNLDAQWRVVPALMSGTISAKTCVAPREDVDIDNR